MYHTLGGSGWAPVAIVPDHLLERVAAAGGVVGVSFAACERPPQLGGGADAVEPAVQLPPFADVAARVVALARRLGAAHVALGADWDGGAVLPAGLDAAALPALGSALSAAGLGAEDLAEVMGGAMLRLLRLTLPTEADMAAGAAKGASSRRRTVAGDGVTFDVWL